jgi:hypothetical protein
VTACELIRDILEQRRPFLKPEDRSLETCMNVPDSCLGTYLRGFCTDDCKTRANDHTSL